MKSICIKTNNNLIIKCLLKFLSQVSLPNIYYTNRKFKIYNNVIIHYKGNKLDDFLVTVSSILSDIIIEFYEPLLIKNSINNNYFYFDNIEKSIIKDICKNQLLYSTDISDYLKNRKFYISNTLKKYLSNSKSIILNGFVFFRLSKYISEINEIVNYSVNQFVIEKEYSEFIHLLKSYIESKSSNFELIHLIYYNNESILMDSSKKIIIPDKKVFNNKFISDISFSSNDYALNSLLNLLPKKIYIHIIDYEDEFIETLKLIFGNRIFICKDCHICKTYKVLTNTNGNNKYLKD